MAERTSVLGAQTERGVERRSAAVARQPVLTALLPIVSVAFFMFLVTGIALPVLPVHVHRDLGFGTFAVGLVAGAQFSAALVSRFWSGRYADTRGTKRATVVGLLLAVAAGLLYLASLRFAGATSVAVLVVGRAVLGAGESCGRGRGPGADLAPPSAAVALAGAALSGLGYTLVYPGYGVEAIRRAPAESRGLAMGAYTAFLDLALGLANPLLGLVAARTDVRAVFLVSALVVLCSAAVAVHLHSAKEQT